MTDVKIKKSTLWIIVIIIVILGLFYFYGNNSSFEGDFVLSGQIGSNVGDIAPDFSITDMDGNQVSLSQFKGKLVALAFFATWCTPCQIEADRLKQIDDETGGRKFIVYQIGVDNRETLSELEQFKSEYGNDDWVVGFGFDVAEQYNVKTLDTTLIIDGEGNIVYRDNGIPASLNQLRKYLI